MMRQASRGRLFLKGGGDDAVQPTQPVKPTSPSGPITRSRAKAIYDKVNSLLSLYTFDVSMNGSLPHGDTFCMLSYEPPMERQEGAKEGQQGGQEEEEAGRKKRPLMPIGISGSDLTRNIQLNPEYPDRVRKGTQPNRNIRFKTDPDIPVVSSLRGKRAKCLVTPPVTP